MNNNNQRLSETNKNIDEELIKNIQTILNNILTIHTDSVTDCLAKLKKIKCPLNIFLGILKNVIF